MQVLRIHCCKSCGEITPFHLNDLQVNPTEGPQDFFLICPRCAAKEIICTICPTVWNTPDSASKFFPGTRQLCKQDSEGKII